MYEFRARLESMDQADRRYFRQQLPELQFETPLRISSLAPELKDLLRLYGYDEIVARTGCRYYAGQVHLGDYQCVAHCWKPKIVQEQKTRQTVIVAHGLFDHSGIYLKLVETLVTTGKTVFLVDFPGHGLSAGEPAAIADFADYAKVIGDSVIKLKQLPEDFGELCLLGQSTGAAAVLHYLLDLVDQSDVKKIILLAPLIRIRRWGMVKAAYPLAKLFGNSVKRSFTTNSNDLEFCDFIRYKDLLQPGRIPLQWIKALMAWVEWIEKQHALLKAGNLRKQKVPLLIVQGHDDRTVNWHYNIPIVSDFFESRDIVHLPQAKHHLVNESKELRLQVLSAAIKFLA